jgi:hypothetical protein
VIDSFDLRYTGLVCVSQQQWQCNARSRQCKCKEGSSRGQAHRQKSPQVNRETYVTGTRSHLSNPSAHTQISTTHIARSTALTLVPLHVSDSALQRHTNSASREKPHGDQQDDNENVHENPQGTHTCTLVYIASNKDIADEVPCV